MQTVSKIWLWTQNSSEQHEKNVIHVLLCLIFQVHFLRPCRLWACVVALKTLSWKITALAQVPCAWLHSQWILICIGPLLVELKMTASEWQGQMHMAFVCKSACHWICSVLTRTSQWSFFRKKNPHNQQHISRAFCSPWKQRNKCRAPQWANLQLLQAS